MSKQNFEVSSIRRYIKRNLIKIYFVDSSANIVRCLQTSNIPWQKNVHAKFPLTFPQYHPIQIHPKNFKILQQQNGREFCIPKLLSPNRSTFQQRNQFPQIPLKNRSTFQHQKKKKNPSLSHSLFDFPSPPQEKILARERKDEFLEQVPPTNFSIPLLFYGTLQADEIKEIAPRMSSL